MGDRVAAVRRDRDREARRHAQADPRPATSRPSSAPGRRRSSSPTGSAARWRASSSRRSTSSRSTRTAASSSPTSSRRSARTSRTSTSRYARSKNLTPYDVLKIASMIEKETVAPSERKLVAAVIYNRLHQKMPLGIDATLRYGLEHPGHRVADQGCDREQQPVQQPEVHRPAADAGRKPGPRLDQGRGPSGRGGLPLLRPHPRHEAALLHRERERVPAQGVRVRVRLQLSVGRRAREDLARRGYSRHEPSPADRDPRHDDARRPARLADVALAVAADAERRVRRAGARLGLRAAADAARAARRRGAGACRRWASPVRT